MNGLNNSNKYLGYIQCNHIMNMDMILVEIIYEHN